jgi:hypothetical protein
MSELLQFHIDMEPESRWNIPTVDPMARASFLYVQETGDFRSKKGYYTTREGLESYLLKLTLSGQGVLEYGGQSHVLKPGDFFWIDCTCRQHYYTDPNVGKWHNLWVHFWGANAEAYYQTFLQAGQNSPIGHLHDRTEAVRIIRQLLDFYEKGSSDLVTDLQAAALLSNLLAGCVGAAAAKDSAPTVPGVLLEIREFLDQAVPAGLDGMETLYSTFDEETTRLAFRLAEEYKLLPSGGSDYHGTRKADISMGVGRGNLAVPAQIYRDLAALAAERQA